MEKALINLTFCFLEESIPPTETRINEGIRAPEVRVIGQDGEQLGVMAPEKARVIAEERGLDLVEIAPNATPPVCRIMDYGKFKFQEAKREHAARAKQKNIVVKEVKFRPRTDDHDFDFKVRHIIKFLEEGDKVKVVVMFRGRETQHRDIGYQIIQVVIARVAEYGDVEKGTSIEGRDMHAILNAKPKAASKPKKPKTETPQTPAPSAE